MVAKSVDGVGAHAGQEYHSEFEILKAEQVELARLASKYVRQQQALRETEHALSHLVAHIARGEPCTVIQDCLSSGAAQIESSSKQRQVLMDASVALSKSVDTFLSTSIVDLQLSMERHEQTRRKLQATEDALLKSRLSLFDAARRTRLQVEVDQGLKIFNDLSEQMAARVRLLVHQRNYQMCEPISSLFECARHSQCPTILCGRPHEKASFGCGNCAFLSF